MQKTYKAIAAFINAASPWLEKNPKDSKFRYAVKKLMKQATARWEEHNEKAQDLQIEHCMADKDGKILKDANGQHEFTKDGTRKLIAERKALFESLVDVAPYMGKDAPDDLAEQTREAFAGFVLPELTDDEAEKAGPHALEQAV